jgi:hypothetical protein
LLPAQPFSQPIADLFMGYFANFLHLMGDFFMLFLLTEGEKCGTL